MPRKKIDKPSEALEELLEFDSKTPEATEEDVVKDDVTPEVETGEDLDITANEAVNLSTEVVNPEPSMSFEQAEIESLRAQLAEAKAEAARAKTHPTDDNGRPLPEAALSPEQRQIRQMEDELARTKGSVDVEPTVVDDGSDGVLVHFLEDGLTSNGRVFYRGEEVTFGPKALEATKNRYGDSWLDMSEDAQVDKWGRIMFRKGPWTGKRAYDDKGAEKFSISSVAPAGGSI